MIHQILAAQSEWLQNQSETNGKVLNSIDFLIREVEALADSERLRGRLLNEVGQEVGNHIRVHRTDEDDPNDDD